MDPELRRVLEESMRTYQQEREQTPGGEGAARENDASELRDTYEGMDVEDDYDAEVSVWRPVHSQLRAAIQESLKESQKDEKKDEKTQ